MISKKGAVIAIDGPAGTGKSSASKRLADALGFTHVDTGALYRAIALEVLNSRVPEAERGKKAGELAHSLHLEFKKMPEKNPSNRIFSNSKDVTDFIRTPEVSMVSSRIAAVPEVRSALLGLQRKLGCQGSSILEGRDIGTVIFPDADVKFFLNATVEERAKRRLAELEAAGADAPSFEEMKEQIAVRDQGDSTRAVAPLKKADDAVMLDTSQMTLDQVVESMAATVRKRLKL